MSIPRKTAKEIADVAIAQIEAQLNQSIPLLPQAFNRVISKVAGLMFVTFSPIAGMLLLNQYVKYASDKEVEIGGIKLVPLDELGSLIGETQLRGQRAEGTTRITSTGSGTLPSGKQLLNPDNGELYNVIGNQAYTSPTTDIFIRAVNYSAAGTLEPGIVLSFVDAPSNVAKETLVLAPGTVVGSDPETTESWRSRQLDWWAARPQGGAYSDYRRWGRIPGVRQIYPYSGPTNSDSQIGFADIYVASEEEDRVADQTLLDAVEANIVQTSNTGLADRAPMNDFVLCKSITNVGFNVSISAPTPDTQDIRDAIETSVDNYFKSRENFIVGLSRLPRKDVVSGIEISGVVGRTAAAQGSIVTSVVLQSDVPIGEIVDYPLQEGEMAYLVDVIWEES